MNLTFLRLFPAGIIGTTAMIGIVYFGSLILNLKPNLVGLIQFGMEHSETLVHYGYIALAIFFVTGSLILPFIYAFLIRLLPDYKTFKHPWLIGIMYAIIMWIVIEVILIPELISLLKFDFLTSQLASVKTAVVCLLGYIGYGATLGAICGDKNEFKS